MPSPEKTTSFAATRKKILSQTGKQYWRSVEEFAESPEYAEKIKGEFPIDLENWDPSLSRRNFVKVMGASLALAGLSGCVIQPPEKIVPYVRQPEDLVPGKPLFFATAMTLGGTATGLLAKSYDGRPVKIEGNPQHPQSMGATDVFAQASLLGMYDPDRSKSILYRGAPRSWQDFVTTVRTLVAENAADGGAGVRFLTETVSSPTLQDQFRRLSGEMPNARWYQYEPINNDNAIAGSRLAFGSPANTIYNFAAAERILTLDADIFSGFNNRYKWDWAIGRSLTEEKQEINRLYAVETTMTLTGAKADHRLAVRPSQFSEVARAIAAAVGVSGATSAYTGDAQWIAAMAKDLREHAGRCLVVAGDGQTPAVHAVAHAMNAALGNVGRTVTYTDPLTPSARTQIEQLRELITDIDAGRVRMLVMLGGNPVYTTPADLKLNRERLDKIAMRIHLSDFVDETSEYCHWHVPENHYLESWSDARAFDGTAAIVQPLIEPLYDGKNAHEVVQLFFRENFEQNDYDIVRSYWQALGIPSSVSVLQASSRPDSPEMGIVDVPNVRQEPPEMTGQAQRQETIGSAPPVTASPSTFEDNWRKAVHDGVIPNTAFQPRTFTVNAAFLAQPEARPSMAAPLEISIVPHPTVYDGRFTNNGWLQELPTPLEKITWENVALISPRTAERLGINRANDPDEVSGGVRGTAFFNTTGTNMFADLVSLSYMGGTISKPVAMWISPGQPDDVITITMGYGQIRGGRVGQGLGYNAFEVMRSDAMNHGFGEIAKTGATANIATTQIHFNLEGRDLLRVFDVDVYKANPEMGHQPNLYPLTMYDSETGTPHYQEIYKDNYRWGMSVDINSCIGCNACVMACQAENNIPVVGKEQVAKSREMHWLRVDTYFAGSDTNSLNGAVFQPLPCQQCEQAPCEVVCPVTATVHSAEGLNDMVYNRCVGTRYCSNNCPYKVRRFNFLLYQDWDTPQYKLMRNPEVTIRSRGVMEKCTYCTQRISAGRIEAEKDGRKIRDGEVITACQAVCPTNAIIFGDTHDPNSKIAAAKRDHRDYTLLNELNTQPRTTYLAGLKNQNREMPDHKPLPIPKSHGAKKEPAEKNAGGEAH